MSSLLSLLPSEGFKLRALSAELAVHKLRLELLIKEFLTTNPRAITLTQKIGEGNVSLDGAVSEIYTLRGFTSESHSLDVGTGIFRPLKPKRKTMNFKTLFKGMLDIAKTLPMVAPFATLIPGNAGQKVQAAITTAGQDIDHIFSAVTDAQIIKDTMNQTKEGAMTGADARKIASIRVADIINQASGIAGGHVEFADPAAAAAKIEEIAGAFGDLAHMFKKK